MAINNNARRVRLSVDVEPELQRWIKIAAAQRDLSVRDYVVDILRQAMDREQPAEESAWSRLSARSFARDWESVEDRAYGRFS